ncbi:MAG: hypothetical protein DRP52_01070 [Planctomycetota bacterium]|nr:MAG: hypothetical protein DRP52_01070 [Planctomycetota bacterium]
MYQLICTSIIIEKKAFVKQVIAGVYLYNIECNNMIQIIFVKKHAKKIEISTLRFVPTCAIMRLMSKE